MSASKYMSRKLAHREAVLPNFITTFVEELKKGYGTEVEPLRSNSTALVQWSIIDKDKKWRYRLVRTARTLRLEGAHTKDVVYSLEADNTKTRTNWVPAYVWKNTEIVLKRVTNGQAQSLYLGGAKPPQADTSTFHDFASISRYREVPGSQVPDWELKYDLS